MVVGNRAGNSGLSSTSPAAEPENRWLAIVGKPCLYPLKDIASSAIKAEGVPIIFVALGCVMGGLGSTRQQLPKRLFYIVGNDISGRSSSGSETRASRVLPLRAIGINRC
jgi:hypothetical protein